ncbi:MAG: hypothetical protein RLZZ226_1601 [Pseudomonadota bacterium]|jgi:hypothetical protein
MTTDVLIHEFIKESLRHGIPRSRIETVLLEAGWKPGQIKRSLSAYADIEFPVPVPRPRVPSPARDTFLYLVLFTTLYISAYNLGSLLFDWLETLLPSPENTRELVWENVRMAIAGLSIALPIYACLSITLSAAIRQHPERRDSAARKWLTYITLFVTASLIIGDLISLVYTLIGGDGTPKYLLKFLIVGLINALIFWYYLFDMREQDA